MDDRQYKNVSYRLRIETNDMLLCNCDELYGSMKCWEFLD